VSCVGDSAYLGGMYILEVSGGWDGCGVVYNGLGWDI
jgi:hypothetical protein